MAASGNAHGLSTRLYRTARIDTPSVTNVASAAIAANEIVDVVSVTPPTVTRTTTAKQSFTTQTDVPVPLRRALGETSFTFILDPADTMHQAIRDDDLATINSYIFAIVDLEDATNITYHLLDGFISSKGTSSVGEDFIEYGVTVMMVAEPAEFDAT